MEISTIDPALFESDLGASANGNGAARQLHPAHHREGDTPFGIAEQYGADGDELMAVNGLDEDSAALLQIGDVLIVPLPGCPLAAALPQTTEAAAAVTETPEPSGTPATATSEPSISPTPSQIPTATLPPTAANAQVEIVRVLSPGDINAEGVDIRNNGAVVDMTGWKLSDASGDTYTFPEQRVFTGGVLTIYTRVGTDTPQAKFWGRDTALWLSGSTITLTDADGHVQSTYIVP